MFFLFSSAVILSTVSGIRHGIVDQSVHSVVDQIASGLVSNGTETLSQVPSIDRHQVTWTLLSLASNFRKEAPLIVQSNYDAFLVDKKQATGILDRQLLVASYSTKTVKELQESMKKYVLVYGNSMESSDLQKRCVFLKVLIVPKSLFANAPKIPSPST